MMTVEKTRRILACYEPPIITFLYIVLFVLVTYFHEPWFDEAQAWEIGKTATYKEIFTVVTHTEGHPPLWSFILSIPAKLGISYYIGLKGISFLFSLAVVYFIEFKSPFPKVVKYLLPFSYFIFYQYGVISRTYCVMELALVLIAILFKERDRKPWRFVAALYLLCLTCTYGILIASGICICWLLDVFAEFGKICFDSFLKDKRVLVQFVLLLAVLPIAFSIIPSANIYAMDQVSSDFFLRKLLYFLFVMPGDSFVSVTGFPAWDSMGMAYVVPGLIVTLILYFIIWLVSDKKDVKYFVTAYVLYSLFMCLYGSGNHVGICMIWYICYIWAVYDWDRINKKWGKTIYLMYNKIKDAPDTRILALLKAIPIVILGFSVAYCIKISVDDIRLPYSESKQIADFIKLHNMENADIMVKWDMRSGSEDDDSVIIDYDRLDSAYTSDAVAILPYFENNIFFNHNIKEHEKGYFTHLKTSDEEREKTYKMWKEHGIPEVLIGYPALTVLYDDISIKDYVPVYTANGYYMGKNTNISIERDIYVRKDCLKKFGLD